MSAAILAGALQERAQPQDRAVELALTGSRVDPTAFARASSAD